MSKDWYLCFLLLLLIVAQFLHKVFQQRIIVLYNLKKNGYFKFYPYFHKLPPSLAFIFIGQGTPDHEKVFRINLGSVDLGCFSNNREEAIK